MYKYMIRKDGGIQVFGAKDNNAAKEKAGEHPLFILIGLNWVPVVNGKVELPEGEFIDITPGLFAQLKKGDVLYCHTDFTIWNIYDNKEKIGAKHGVYYEIISRGERAISIMDEVKNIRSFNVYDIKNYFSLPYSSALLNGANATGDDAEAKN